MFYEKPERYIIGFRPPKNPSTLEIFLFLSLSSFSLPDLSFLLSFFSFFPFFLFSSLPFLSSGQQPSRRTPARTQARHRHDPSATQAGRQAPAQARSGPVQAASSDPPRGQLVRELSRARQTRFVDDFLDCTRRLVAAVVVVTYKLSEIDSEVRSSRNGLSKKLGLIGKHSF